MIKIVIPLLIASFLSLGIAYGQVSPAKTNEQLLTIASKEKTLSSWDILGLLYQVAANDVTSDNKSVTFKSTLFGIRKVFNKKLDNDDNYRRLWLDRNFEPNLAFDYKNNFNPSNLSVGFNLGVITANDVSSAPIFNDANTMKFKDYGTSLDNGPIVLLDDKIMKELATKYPGDNKTQKAIQNTIEDAKTKFIVSGDPNSLKNITLPDGQSLTAALQGMEAEDLEGKKTTLYDALIKLAKYYDRELTRVKNKWNVVFSPTATYAFYASSFQGYEFALKSIKGFCLFKDTKRTSQLLISGSLKIGDDTIVAKIRINRRQITDQIGFNQVLFTKKNTDQNGTTSESPVVEASLTGGCNWIMSGLSTKEKELQPVLKAKIGLMVGKNSWLVFPFTYNFTTKTGQGSISLTVNFGDPPFKSSGSNNTSKS